MFFPMFVDLSRKDILIVGAGTIATRRICTLSDFAECMTVVAPEVSGEVAQLAADGRIVLRKERFTEELLVGRDLVLAATDDAMLNREIVCLCRKKGIPANSSSEKELCDFYFPSVIEHDGVVIGINASGKNHSLVKQTRMKLEELLEK